MALSRRIALPGQLNRSTAARFAAPLSASAPLPVRLRHLLRRLRAPSRRGLASESVLQALALAHTPGGIAARLGEMGFEWLGGQGWAVLGQEEGRALSWLWDRGITSTRRSAVTALAARAVRAGQPAWSEDASRLGPTRLRTPFSALALPLRCEGRVVGVLAGIDKAAGVGGRAGSPPFDSDQGAASASPGASALDDGRLGEASLPDRADSGASLPDRADSREALPDWADFGEAVPGVGQDLGLLWRLLDPLAAALDAQLRLVRAEKLSSIDDLTGLYNSRYLAGALARETKRALRTKRPLSVLFVDLDGFKGINDRWGHLCGSRALVEAAGRIASAARETDIVARYGGDEFAIVLPETPDAGAMIVAQRLRERIAAHTFLEADGIGYRLTASVGVATLPDAALTSEELLTSADAAMYRVKARGKDGIEQAGANKT